jgi:hypothetical protein
MATSTKAKIAALSAQFDQHMEDEQLDLAQATLDEYSELAKTKAQKARAEEMDAAIAAYGEEGEEGEEAYSMSNQLKKYRTRYHRSVAASGAKSLNNGDDLANYLQMKTGKDVCELADKFVPLKGGEKHFDRYARLNEGQKRMNAGNKLRAAVKNGQIVVTETGIKSV